MTTATTMATTSTTGFDNVQDKHATGMPPLRTTAMRLPAPLTRPRPQLVRDLTRGLPSSIKRTIGNNKEPINLSAIKSPPTPQQQHTTKTAMHRRGSRDIHANAAIYPGRTTITDPMDTSHAKEETATTTHPYGIDPSIPIIPTSRPTSPVIVIMAIEGSPFYVTTLGPAQGFSRDFRMMRRVDTGYVNASALLEAGGIETESERSIILSLEIGRMRVPQRESELFGTWIPLGRARALAATCSLQNRLGPFLNDNLATYFPSPLPTEEIETLCETAITSNNNAASNTNTHVSDTATTGATTDATSKESSLPAVTQVLAQTLSHRLASLGLDNNNVSISPSDSDQLSQPDVDMSDTNESAMIKKWIQSHR
ncbi:hypothetical protein BDF19DRAFT_412252 [Syncephalis fuscata]|nr:hypothetical protein BDF19DRAFT_412252 [Syncephalis fuscata]